MQRKIEPSKAFTLIELLVVIAIISLLVSILLPSLQTAKEMAKSTQCMGNLRITGMGIVFYAEDYEGLAPPWQGTVNETTSKRWTWYLRQYIESVSAISCPAWLQDDDPWFGMAQSYGMNRGSNEKAWRGVDKSITLAEPGYWDGPQMKFVITGPASDFPMIADTRLWDSAKNPSELTQSWDFTYPKGSWSHIHPRHLGRANIWFPDGRIESCDDDALMNQYGFIECDFWYID